MGIRSNLACGSVAAIVVLASATAAQANVVLTTASGSITASGATEKSSTGTPQRAQWDLATMKGARSSAPQQPFVVTLEKVNVQDLHFVCSSKTAARVAGGGVTAMDDWQKMTCKAPSATIQDGGKTYELTDVTFASGPATGCDGACGPDVANLDISFMAINEKGLPGTKTGTKNSTK